MRPVIGPEAEAVAGEAHRDDQPLDTRRRLDHRQRVRRQVDQPGPDRLDRAPRRTPGTTPRIAAPAPAMLAAVGRTVGRGAVLIPPFQGSQRRW